MGASGGSSEFGWRKRVAAQGMDTSPVEAIALGGSGRAKFCSAALPGKSMSYAISSRSAELEW